MNSIQENVELYCFNNGKTRKELADAMQMPYSTFLTKLNGPSEFSFSEGARLGELIGLTADQMRVGPFTQESSNKTGVA